MRIHTIRRLLVWTHRFFRFLVRAILTVVVCAALLFLYLRVLGLPDFVLKRVMQRVNDAGVPVSVERMVLTMGGWRAEGIRYYSEDPDDLKPLFYVETVYFSVLKNPDGVGMNVDVDMLSIRLTPSAKWKVNIPENSDVLRLKRVKAILSFSPREILLADGETTWLDFHFHINGKILKGKKSHLPEGLNVDHGKTFSFSEEQFQALKKQLEIFDLSKGVDVNIDFVLDTEKYEKSHLNFALFSEDVFIKKIPFSTVEIKGNVTDVAVNLDHFVLFQDQKSMRLSGEYNWKNQRSKVHFFNSIVSTNILTFVPPGIKKQVSDLGFEINELPHLDLHFGPTTFPKLLNDIKGSFSMQNFVYQGLTIENVRANVRRIQQRIEVNNIQATVQGQEEDAIKMGSSMRGGVARGSVFWDGGSHEFGVEGDMNFDPNLLLKPLSFVALAVEIIDFFKLKDAPPHAHVELGAMVDNWQTFYLTIKGRAEDGFFRGVAFSSLNTKAVYKNLKLRLDPLVVLQGTSFLKGSTLIDFHNSTAEFEGSTTLNPLDLEAAIYPSSLRLFTEKIKLSGNVRLAGEGLVDWSKSMKKMDFKVDVASDNIEIPIGYAQHIKAEVKGKGPVISVEKATFAICSGSGEGSVKIDLGVLPHSIPYVVDARFSKINFQKILMRYSTNVVSTTGVLSGSVKIKADMATNFFDKATGDFSIKIQDGKLTDLPLFKRFSKTVRFVLPKFKAFSITRLVGDFKIANGKISSDDVLFSGDVISAIGRGSYSPKTGFDALVQSHILKKKGLFGIIDFVTSPFTKLFEMHLTGTLSDPVWGLGTFTRLKE